MEVDKGKESESMEKKIEKSRNPKLVNLFEGKSTLKRFSFN